MSAVLFERLGHRGAALAEPLLERVGELCAAAAEAAEAADAEDEEEGEEGAVGMQYAGAAAAAMSAALRHLGPENVLRDLPLNLEEVRGAPLWLFLMVVCPVSQIEGHCSRKSYLIRSLLAPSLTLEQEQVLHRAGLNSAHMCHTDDVLWRGWRGGVRHAHGCCRCCASMCPMHVWASGALCFCRWLVGWVPLLQILHTPMRWHAALWKPSFGTACHHLLPGLKIQPQHFSAFGTLCTPGTLT